MIHDVRFALRSILAHRWFSAAIVATLALGIGLNTMVFTLVYVVLYKPFPVTNGARLVAAADQSLAHPGRQSGVSYPDFLEYRAQTRSFDGLEGSLQEGAVLSETAIPPRSYSLDEISSGMFDMLHINPILGRGFLPSDDKPGSQPVVLLSYNLWKSRYAGASDVIGRVVRVNSNPVTIIGVMPQGVQFPSNQDLWMPLMPTAALEKRSNHSVTPYGILKPGISITMANAELSSIAQRLAREYPESNKDTGILLQTFQQLSNGRTIRVMFLSMLAAVGFVLLIVCANVANMMLSRALARQREMSLRAALGATRWRIIRQLLIESMTLSVLAGIAGLGLAALGVHWFDLSTQNVGKPSWMLFQMDYSVYAYFAVLCVATGIVSGLAPALRISRVDLNSTLKEGSRSAGTRRGGLLSSVLVVFQFALTLVLLTGAGVFIRAFFTAQEVNPWLPANQILASNIYLPHERYADAQARVRFFDQLLPRLRSLPGVRQAALVSSRVGNGTGDQHFQIEGSPELDPAKAPSAAVLVQSPGEFGVIGLPIFRGRDFNETDGTKGKEAAIVTRDFAARYWPGEDPVGKRFHLYDADDKPQPWLTVVGVSGDMLQDMFAPSPLPLVFIPYRQVGYEGIDIMLRANGDPSSLGSSLRSTVQDIDQEEPVSDIDTLQGHIYHDQWFLRVFGTIFFVFAFFGLLIAAVGIYAVIAQATVSRTQEIGVRMALGASSRTILTMVLSRGARQLFAGFAIGLVAAYPAARLMATLPLHFSASDPVLFATISALLIGVGLFACWLPARRAAAMDPVKAIRYE
jgi:predicted permease